MDILSAQALAFVEVLHRRFGTCRDELLARREVRLDGGVPVTAGPARAIEDEELGRIRSTIGAQAYAQSRFADARELFEQVALAGEFVLTVPAYRLVD